MKIMILYMWLDKDILLLIILDQDYILILPFLLLYMIYLEMAIISPS